MRIAVTGGTGFIGFRTVMLARQYGHEAWAFDRPNDIMGELDALEGAEAVINLAGILGTAELFDRPHEAVHINVGGALRIIQWCDRNDAHYVGITMPPVFPSIYTATKICADRLASAYHYASGLAVSKVRAYNAYGPGQKWGEGHPQKFLPTFALRGWQNRPLPIWGDGEQTIDMVHVDDVARMLIDACQHGDDVTFDAGTGTAVTVNEFAKFVLGVTGSSGGIEYLPMRLGELPTRVVAEGEGWDRLGWRPELNWDRVEDAIRWYRAVQ